MLSATAFGPATSFAAVTAYQQDFEGLDASDPNALNIFGGENYVGFGDVWFGGVGTGVFLYNYGGVFVAPNASSGDGSQISAVAGGEGGAEQGAQYLNIFSDYNNADHTGCGGAGCDINTSIFQEFTIDAGDIGSTWTFSFDAKSPFSGGISDAFTDNGGNFTIDSTSASAFIKTLDPNAGFATTNDLREDMTIISNTEWNRFSISIDLTNAALTGQLIQFGFNTIATNYDNSGVYYDNVCFSASGDDCFTSAIPIPAAVWLFGSGLLGLVGVARRRKG